MDQRSNSHPKGGTEFYDPGWGQLHTEPHARQISCHATIVSRTRKRNNLIFFWRRSLEKIETSGYIFCFKVGIDLVVYTFIISCFAVCWLPVQFVIMGHLCGLRSLGSMSLHYALAAIAYLYLCANPFIYATGIYQFLRVKFVAALRRLVRGENQVADADEGNLGTAQRRNDPSASTSRVWGRLRQLIQQYPHLRTSASPHTNVPNLNY